MRKILFGINLVGTVKVLVTVFKKLFAICDGIPQHILYSYGYRKIEKFHVL